MIWLLLKVSLSTAFCQVQCGPDEGCCSEPVSECIEQKEVACSEDEAPLDSHNQEDCHCPSCHAHIIPQNLEGTLTEFNELSETEHAWIDLTLDPYLSNVFHPPC